MISYEYNNCKLCGSLNYRDLFSNIAIKTITSDGNPSDRYLKKLECLECGLVREGEDFNFNLLENHYENNYSVNTAEAKEEHVFFKNGLPIPRNAAMLSEIVDILKNNDIDNFKSIFEIGAGQGDLIKYMKSQWPDKNIGGVELSRQAINIAKQNGIHLLQGDETKIPVNSDLAIAVTVFEHVPDPSLFLTNIYNRLSDNGNLILIQPVQSGISYDILYTDHLHHFNEKHVEWFANQAGFEQIDLKLDTWFSNCMSIHLLTKSNKRIIPNIQYIKQEKVEKSIEYWMSIFNNFDRNLSDIVGKKLAVYGMSEVLGLLIHFTKLKNYEIVCGIDDFPERHQKNRLNVPVYSSSNTPEDVVKKIDFCILSANKIYYPKLIESCTKLGIQYITLV
jgi:SAM-dependent methyltransferase